MQKSPVLHVMCGAPEYPVRLRRLSPAPKALWFEGVLPPSERVVALVGSRAASGRALSCAVAMACDLAAAGHAVVSGGAFGVDAAAHSGALEAGASTWAVLGCGVDIIYPDRHASLFRRIVASGGGLLAEYPPGTQPRAGQFPARNRLIAALADVVVVVEAAGKSGALITARQAGKLGVPVLAVPGSPGCDRLLNAGVATAVRDGADVRAVLSGRAPAAVLRPVVPGAFAALVDALAERSDGPAGLAARLSLPLSDVMGRLTEAEIEGWVRRVAGGQYEVSRGH